jgi:hypothetical protein
MARGRSVTSSQETAVDSGSVKEAANQIEARCEKLHQRALVAVRVAILAIGVLGVALVAISSLLRTLNAFVPSLGWILVALGSVVSVLQIVDWLYSANPIHRYIVSYDRLITIAIDRLYRRRLRSLFRLQGEQFYARAVLSDREAKQFSIAYEDKRRTHRRRFGAVVAAAAVALGWVWLLWYRSMPSEIHDYTLDQSFDVGSGVGLTMLRPPVCTAGSSPSHGTCSVEMTIKNLASVPQTIGPGSFEPFTLINGVHLEGAIFIALGRGRAFYDYTDATIPEGLFQPGEAVHATLRFDVPSNVRPDVLVVGIGQTHAQFDVHFSSS